MIAVQDLWNSVNRYAAKYQSGNLTVANFNSALAEVQLEVYNDLSPYYQDNEKVRDLLNVWVNKLSDSIVNGVYTVSNTIDFDRLISIGILDTNNPPNIIFELDPITEGELVYVNRIPQRKPDITKNRGYYYMDGPTTINMFPKVFTLPFLMYYLVYPALAKIAFTESETDDEDILTYDSANSTDLLWTKDATNIILYKMLEKYGIGTRDQWVAEYAKLGIMETLNTGGTNGAAN